MKDNKEKYSEETEIKEKNGVKLTDEELEGAAGGTQWVWDGDHYMPVDNMC